MVDQSVMSSSLSAPLQASDNICRVCRSEGSSDKPLYYPCVCTGSIKYIHQDCLVQWLKYSKKEYCELCNHPFSFAPVYSPDMPKRLPVSYLLMGLVRSISKAVRFWFHYTLVAIAWLIFVPLTACRIYRLLFTSLTVADFLNVFSSSNILSDSFSGCFVVICTLSTFVSIIWLRDQILIDGGPAWLGRVIEEPAPIVIQPEAAPAAAAAGEGDEAAAAAIPEPRVVDPNEANAEGEANVRELPAEPVPEPAPANNNNEEAGDHWNLLDFDRAGEDVSWERLLGLDGSLIFLEHVFWIVSMNSSFIVIFAFVPYHIGLFAMYLLNISDKLSAIKFHSLLTSLFGYFMIAVLLVIILTLFSLTNKTRAKRLVGISYMIVKVSLLIIVDFGVFPLICGWWLDVCSLSMFSDSFKDRMKSFDTSPMAFVFIRWLIGMIYVFYFASFILLLREVIRPGVLFFIRNINDPNFNPIQEMIHIPIYRHIRRFLASVVVFGSIVVLMLWLPVKTIKTAFPLFLPYHVRMSSDSPVHELSLELLLLQVILPALLEQGYTRSWLKNLVKAWCVGMSWLLGLRSFLLGDELTNEEAEAARGVIPGIAAGAEDDEPEVDGIQAVVDNVVARREEPYIPARAAQQQPPLVVAAPLAPLAVAPPPVPHIHGQNPLANLPEEMRIRLQQIQNNIRAAREHVLRLEREVVEPVPIGQQPAGPQQPGLADAHQDILNRESPLLFQSYLKPSWFITRILLLCTFICGTLFICSTLSLMVPVYIGRSIMSLWMGGVKIHELYTCSCGLYTVWVVLRVTTIVYRWVPQGWPILGQRIRLYGLIALKTLTVAFFVMGIIPLMLGQLLDFTVLSPLRVPFDSSPIHRPWQNWALGVLHMKLACVCIMLTQSIFHRELEQIYNQGFRRMDIKFIFEKLCFPVIRALSYALTIPYIISYSLMPMFVANEESLYLCQRIIYPLFLGVLAVVLFCVFQAKQFRNLYEHIKNDRYLVGKQLVNYDKRRKLIEK